MDSTGYIILDLLSTPDGVMIDGLRPGLVTVVPALRLHVEAMSDEGCFYPYQLTYLCDMEWCGVEGGVSVYEVGDWVNTTPLA